MQRLISLFLMLVIGVLIGYIVFSSKNVQDEPTQQVVEDPYAGWTTVTPGGVVAMKIPPGCEADAGAGSMYIVCPTADNPQPTPDMVASSDGVSVNIRRWEDQTWEYWDKVIESIRVITPVDHDIAISIQK